MVEIYGTLGPACASADTLAAMLREGMTGVRLNLSHISLPEADPMVEALREAGRRCGVTPKLLIDMQGPELRICALSAPIELREGERVPLDFVPAPIREKITAGQEILLDDGRFLLRALDAERAEVLRGGLLASRKSIALPGVELRLPPLTESDRRNLALARTYGVTGVMQPFVRCRADLDELRRALEEAGAGEIRIFAKIENREGVAR
ncbi:MAG: pyruvate kinase, partial [Clostridia bacterium]